MAFFMAHNPAEAQRLDKWLWMARFYKSRSQAADAIKGGHVHVNGERSKAARQIRVEDKISVSKGPYRWQIEVKALAARRGPASEAQSLYQETPQSRQQRETLRGERQYSSPAPAKRPDKHARQKIIRFINKDNRNH